MKKLKAHGKLTLNKATISKLNKIESRSVVGGSGRNCWTNEATCDVGTLENC